MPLEVEARFRADGPDVLDKLAGLASLGHAALGEPDTVDEVDIYLDTAEGAFAASRWAARLRSRGGRYLISVKGPPEAGSGEAWLHRRPELEGPATNAPDPLAWPESEARDLVQAIADGAALHERFTLRQRRTERGVRLDRPIGTLSLDAVIVEREGREVGRIEIVELELRAVGEAGPAAEAVLRTLAAALSAIPGLRPEPRTKLEHALALIGAS